MNVAMVVVFRSVSVSHYRFLSFFLSFFFLSFFVLSFFHSFFLSSFFHNHLLSFSVYLTDISVPLSVSFYFFYFSPNDVVSFDTLDDNDDDSPFLTPFFPLQIALWSITCFFVLNIGDKNLHFVSIRPSSIDW